MRAGLAVGLVCCMVALFLADEAIAIAKKGKRKPGGSIAKKCKGNIGGSTAKKCKRVEEELAGNLKKYLETHSHSQRVKAMKSPAPAPFWKKTGMVPMEKRGKHYAHHLLNKQDEEELSRKVRKYLDTHSHSQKEKAMESPAPAPFWKKTELVPEEKRGKHYYHIKKPKKSKGKHYQKRKQDGDLSNDTRLDDLTKDQLLEFIRDFALHVLDGIKSHGLNENMARNIIQLAVEESLPDNESWQMFQDFMNNS